MEIMLGLIILGLLLVSVVVGILYNRVHEDSKEVIKFIETPKSALSSLKSDSSSNYRKVGDLETEVMNNDDKVVSLVSIINELAQKHGYKVKMNTTHHGYGNRFQDYCLAEITVEELEEKEAQLANSIKDTQEYLHELGKAHEELLTKKMKKMEENNEK